MRQLIDVSIGFLVIGTIEAVIKPISKRFVKRKIIQYAPMAMEFLDKKIPGVFGSEDGESLEESLMARMEELTGESWSKAQVDELFRLYDPRITADKSKT